MRGVRILFLLLIALAFQMKTSWGQKGKFEALYIYNICRYIEWPAGFTNNTFTIGIVGKNEELESSLKTIAQSKTIQGKNVDIKGVTSPAGTSDCNIVFFTSGSEGKIGSYLGAAKNYLICSENVGEIPAGSDINFYIDGNKLRFDLSNSNVSKKAIRISASLKQLATNIE